jgi:uncharacterized protein YbjQ (UPF0145 family)
MSIQACRICGKDFDAFNRMPDKIWCDDCYQDGNKITTSIKEENKKAAEELVKQEKEITLKIQNIKLTTTPEYPNKEVEDVLGIVTSECVYGMNVFRDVFAAFRDTFGGRSKASQKVLRDARNICLDELKKDAYELGADGVIGIDLDYQEISGQGKGMLFLVASGTAVKFKK